MTLLKSHHQIHQVHRQSLKFNGIILMDQKQHQQVEVVLHTTPAVLTVPKDLLEDI